jgi:hypothetical protein
MLKKSASKVSAAASDCLSVRVSPLLILSIPSDAAEIPSGYTRAEDVTYHVQDFENRFRKGR